MSLHVGRSRREYARPGDRRERAGRAAAARPRQTIQAACGPGMSCPSRRVVVVGSGPNGLAAAIDARAGGPPGAVLEARDDVGGGARTAELTLPGFVHDVCSAVHPLASSSPFFRTLPLERARPRVDPPAAPLAHPLDDGTAVMLERSVEATARGARRRRRAVSRLVEPVRRRLARAARRRCCAAAAASRATRCAASRFGAHGAALGSTGSPTACSAGERARALFAGLRGALDPAARAARRPPRSGSCSRSPRTSAAGRSRAAARSAIADALASGTCARSAARSSTGAPRRVARRAAARRAPCSST